MKVETYLFGEIEINPDTVLTFPKGLAGFEDKTRFTIIHEAEAGETPASYTLQSLDDAGLAFQIIDPARLGFEYQLYLGPEEEACIGFENAADLVIMLLLTKGTDEAGNAAPGANLRAPLIINTAKRLGMQKVTTNLRPNILLSELSQGV